MSAEPQAAQEEGEFYRRFGYYAPISFTSEEVTRALNLYPERVAHSFAMKYGLREHLTYEQAMALERDLNVHLRAWLADPS